MIAAIIFIERKKSWNSTSHSGILNHCNLQLWSQQSRNQADSNIHNQGCILQQSGSSGTHKVVWVATEPAYTETKEIVEMVPYSYCFMCKKRFYKDDIAADGEYISDHTYNHIMNGDPYSNIIDGEKETSCSGNRNCYRTRIWLLRSTVAIEK